jgi:hypothetical protein
MAHSLHQSQRCAFTTGPSIIASSPPFLASLSSVDTIHSSSNNISGTNNDASKNSRNNSNGKEEIDTSDPKHIINTSFLRAIQQNDVASMEGLLAMGVELDNPQWPFMVRAAGEGKFEAVQFLLEKVNKQ